MTAHLAYCEYARIVGFFLQKWQRSKPRPGVAEPDQLLPSPDQTSFSPRHPHQIPSSQFAIAGHRHSHCRRRRPPFPASALLPSPTAPSSMPSSSSIPSGLRGCSVLVPFIPCSDCGKAVRFYLSTTEEHDGLGVLQVHQALFTCDFRH